MSPCKLYLKIHTPIEILISLYNNNTTGFLTEEDELSLKIDHCTTIINSVVEYEKENEEECNPINFSVVRGEDFFIGNLARYKAKILDDFELHSAENIPSFIKGLAHTLRELYQNEITI